MDNPLFWTKPSLGKRFQVDTGGTLTNGLISYWKMEDSTDYWGTNNGTATNITFSAGKVDNAGVSSTTTSNIDFGVIAPTVFTLNFWVYINDTSISGQILGNSYTFTGFRCYYSGGGGLNVDCTKNSSTAIASTSLPLPSGKYFMITISVGPSGMKVYNGTSQHYSNTSITSCYYATPNTYSFKLFRAGGFNFNSFLGKLDEVGLWNRELTTTEIADLYNSGSGQTMIS